MFVSWIFKFNVTREEEDAGFIGFLSAGNPLPRAIYVKTWRLEVHASIEL